MGVRHRDAADRGRAVPPRVDPHARGQAACSRTSSPRWAAAEARREPRAARSLAAARGRRGAGGDCSRRRSSEIARGRARARSQIAALLVALRTKGETVDEIVGGRARAARGTPRRRRSPDPRTVDTCGTGGDGADTFNISTTAAFVVAGAGVPVAKHGNRAASSRAGSVDVLEALGVNADLPVAAAARLLREVGIGALLRARARTRRCATWRPCARSSAIRTRDELPRAAARTRVGARRQLVGVYDARARRADRARARGSSARARAGRARRATGSTRSRLTGPTYAALLEQGAVRSLAIEPGALGLPLAPAAALARRRRGGERARSRARCSRARPVRAATSCC